MLELTYHWEGDYLIPDLEPPEAPRIGKYGTIRHNYLRDYHTGVFDGMLLSGKLNAHLEEVDRQANEMMELLTTQMAKAEGITEQLKAADQMAWGAGLRWRPLPQAEAPTEPAGETRRHEQHHGQSRGDRPARADLHINSKKATAGSSCSFADR